MLKTMTIVLFSVLISATLTAQSAPPVYQFEYDANGNITKLIDGLSNSNTFQYDALDRLNKHKQPNPSGSGQLGEIGAQYNAISDITQIVDPRSLITSYSKNAFGETLSQSSPDTGLTLYTYDEAGNLKTRTDARGKITSYTYDAANRLIQANRSDEQITYQYDQGTNGQNRLTTISNPQSILTWQYDAQGRVTRQEMGIQQRSFVIEKHYDAAGRLARLIYPSGRYVDYGYNLNGQISQIAVDGQLMLNAVSYNATGTIQGWIWGNGQSYQRSIDDSGRTVSYQIGQQLQHLTYDNAGRITHIHRSTISNPTSPLANTISSYTYDNLDRLTQQTTSNANTGYQYDLNSNRTQLIIGANSYPYNIASNSNKLNAETGPTPRSYTYHPDGSISSNGQDQYSYYDSGRLKQINRDSVPIYLALYNGLSERVKETISGTHYVYDAGNPQLLGEYDSNASPLQETVYLYNTPVLVMHPGVDVQNSTFMVFSDHLDTPRMITDQNNQIRWTWQQEQSEAFGANAPDENPQSLGIFRYNLRFPGQLYHPQTQLSYNYYRDYNPRTGRYTESDPIGLEGGINTYEYVGGNPLWYTDGEGLAPSSQGSGSGSNNSSCEENDWSDYALAAAMIGGDIALGGPTGEGIMPALAILGAKNAGKNGLKAASELSSKAARRKAMRDRNVPTSRATKSQKQNRNGTRQDTVEDSNGKPSVQSQHLADDHHPSPHWHSSSPKQDPITGAPRTNQHGSFKYENGGSSVPYK